MSGPEHDALSASKPLRIVISGASGFLGGSFAGHFSRAGHRVQRLVRRPPRPGEEEIGWEPARGEMDSASLEGADALVNFSGENLAGGRWTKTRKTALWDSRVNSTRLLAETLAKLNKRPRVFVSASAVGFYGNRGAEPLDEASPPGQGFLPDLCVAWEEATEPARQAGVRVVNLRLGLVLSARGGALPRMLLPFRLGLGGRVGNGNQVWSWIGLEDLLAVVGAVIEIAAFSGPVNAVAPHPATNAEFTRTLARVLRRPAIFPLPAAVVRLMFGEMGENLLLQGAHVLPKTLAEQGFQFGNGDLESALRSGLRPAAES